MMRRSFIGLFCTTVAGALGWGWIYGSRDKRHRHAIIQSVFAAKTLPTMTEQHLQLIRQLRVMWVPEESGAPGVDPLLPLQSSHSVVESAMQVLQTSDSQLAIRTLAEVCRLIPEFVTSASLEPGLYALPPNVDWHDASTAGKQSFSFLAEHLVLLNAAQWRDISSTGIESLLKDEDPRQPLWPMPYIDGKRPYGSRSYYQIDIAELLGKPYAKDMQGKYILPPDKDAAFEHLHQQTQAALQILLMYGSPKPAVHSS